MYNSWKWDRGSPRRIRLGGVDVLASTAPDGTRSIMMLV